MKKPTLVLVEAGMLFAIVLAALTVPPSTSLAMFLIVSGIAFSLGNVLLYKRLNQAPNDKGASNVNRKSSLYAPIILMAVYWLWWFFMRMGRFR